MAKRKRPRSVDPSISDLIDYGERQQKLRQKSPKERAKAKKDMARSKATYDLPQEIIRLIERIAAQEECPQSGVAGLLLYYAIRLWEAGGINFSAHKRRSRSPRWEWVLEIPPLSEEVED